MATTLSPSAPRPPTSTIHTRATLGSPPHATTGRRHIARVACRGARHGGHKIRKKDCRDASGWVTTGGGRGGQRGGKAPRKLQRAIAPSLGPRVRRRRPRRPTAASVATVGVTDRAASAWRRARARSADKTARVGGSAACSATHGCRCSHPPFGATGGTRWPGGETETQIPTRLPLPSHNRTNHECFPDHEGELLFRPIAPLRQRSDAVRHSPEGASHSIRRMAATRLQAGTKPPRVHCILEKRT